MCRYHKTELQQYQKKMLYPTFEVIYTNVNLGTDSPGDSQPGLTFQRVKPS